MTKKRNRLQYAILTFLTIGLGLFSRTSYIPALIYPYLGDMLYTLMFYFIIGFLFPKLAPYKVAILSIGICFMIECSQLYQADWINQIRANKLGRLILGHGFLWSDLVSYTAGGLLGFFTEKRK